MPPGNGRTRILYALGAAGERGVDRVLDWFRADMLSTMSLLGVEKVEDLNRSELDMPKGRYD